MKYQRVRNFFNGQFVESVSTADLDVISPIDGNLLSTVPMSTTEELSRAVASAKAAAESWGQQPIKERVQVFFRYRNLLEKNSDELTTLIAEENGKTWDEAKAEVDKSIELTEFACSMPQLVSNEVLEVSRGVECRIEHFPVGVVASIAPFNFPLMVPNWTMPNALVLGNTMIMKPSELVPLSVIRMAELLQEAGLPDGVFNVVQGDKTAVDALLAHPSVAGVSFVGSTPIAKHIHETASRYGKRVQALGGAKNHMVVMPDADLDQAVDALIGAAYGSAGERCMAVSVAVVVGAIADRLVARLAERVPKIRVTQGMDRAAEMGPLVTRAHLDKVRGYVDAGVAEGAKLVVDGRALKVDGHEQGFFLGGCLFDDVQPGMRIYREEIFGPVLSIVRADSFETALRLVNEHEYGNGCAIFTRDGDAAREFANRVQVGMVGVNVPIPVPMAFHSFGGWKSSLFGDHHMHGPEGVRFYTRLKAVTQRWPAGIRAGAEFVMPTMK